MERRSFCGSCRKPISGTDRMVVRVLQQRRHERGVGSRTEKSSQVTVCNDCVGGVFEGAESAIQSKLEEER